MKTPLSPLTSALPRRAAPLLLALLLGAASLVTTPATMAASPAGTSASPAAAEALAGDELPPNADAMMRTSRFRGLAAELRCLVCQNQNLLDSHAPLAADLRHEVVRLMAQGLDDRQVKQHLVDRYGEFVLYRPTWSWRNALLWLGPALMLLAGGFVLWRVFSRRQAAPAATGPDGDTALSSGEEALARVDALLAGHDDKRA